MDKKIKTAKNQISKKMDKLVSQDKKRDKECDAYKMKAKKPK